ncbi:ATP-binding protein [Algoriphagus aestuariicola]|uniref:ATP-binding protein n=1 Tax=Algoriphagus aestuariicola TaxID=1852016 RepID=A0ABS3BKJ2_9BACT|nr:ATP-binding protein [Algoriphagus aestuariicola]MBN7799827.1 ATP-binding protein [Algoriphagus aestuariicola]
MGDNKIPSGLSNSECLESELAWFQELLILRGKITFEQSAEESQIEQFRLPDFADSDSPYARLVKRNALGIEERLVLVLSLLPHIKPHLLDVLHIKNQTYDTPFTEFGGIKGEKHRGFLPTGETAVFLLAGSNLEKRFRLLRLFEPNHFFAREKILSLESTSKDEPFLSGILKISKEYLSILTTGEVFKPDFDMDFPAKRISTDQEWSDLVIGEEVLQGVREIQNWLIHGHRLKKDFKFGRRIKPGFRALFTGPPGTGKTLTATLLGKACQLDVYRIDLSMIVSKYIGETEKNLSKVFDLAENKNWILFFDEADALFGKRTQTSDSHDRYANQEVSYLLQRIEDFDGLVILCSNYKNNIDEAFFRRFQLVVDFDLPDYFQRLRIWESAPLGEFEYEAGVNLSLLAEKHELTAAAIVNVLHFCLLKTMERGDGKIRQEDIQQAIRLERVKEGKSIVR